DARAAIALIPRGKQIARPEAGTLHSWAGIHSMKIDHILVATDLSPEATTCIPSVASLAREVGARITLLHVLEALEAIPHGSPLAPPLRVSDDPEAAQRAREQLEERRAAFGPGIDIKIELIAGGDAAHEIVEYARSEERRVGEAGRSRGV